MTAEEIIALLELSPHPEGGHFRETFRDAVVLADGRNASTAIYFLLDADEISRWHRVDASEIWLWHAGATLELSIAEGGGQPTCVQLGSVFTSGHRPQAVIPAKAWQQARADGGWVFVSCVVAPGFSFEGFEMAPEGFEPGSILDSDPL